MTGRPTALERLLDLRRAEEAGARGALQRAIAEYDEAARALARAVDTCDRAAAALDAYCVARQQERRSGFTIAQMHLDAQGADALRAALGRAEQARSVAGERAESAAVIKEERLTAYDLARRATEAVRSRVGAADAHDAAQEARREESDTLDALVARDHARKQGR